MADTVQSIDYFYMETPDKPGAAASALQALQKERVNLLAFSGFPSGNKAQLDFIPRDSRAFSRAARKAGLKVGPRKSGFLIQGNDRSGALASHLGKLAEEGINVTAVDALTAGKGRYGAILWVKPQDHKRAAKALGAKAK